MYRTRWQPDQFFSLQVRTVRWLTLAALLAYPPAALVAGLATDGEAVGSLAKIVATIAALLGLVVIGSHTHQLTAGEPTTLDEYQLQLRHRALSKAYGLLAALLLGALLYLSLASDFDLWVPTTEDHWNGVFWGAFLYATLLPTAVLAWTTSSEGEGELEEDA